MRKQEYTPVRETVLDLYNEKEAVPWYLKTLAVLSTWFALVGYVLFTLAYSAQDDGQRLKRHLLAGFGAGFLAFAYIFALIAAGRSSSLLFCYDGVFIPTFSTALKGIFITVVYKAVMRQPPNMNSAYVWGPLALSIFMTVASFIMAVLAKSKLRKIRLDDQRRRQRINRTDRESYGGDGKADASSIELLRMQIPETEAQRQQLLKLLLQRENARTPSPDSTSNTYHIDMPQEYSAISQPYLSPTLTRTSTSPKKGIFVSQISPSRGRSPTTESFKDPRELKREAIERSTIAQAR